MNAKYLKYIVAKIAQNPARAMHSALKLVQERRMDRRIGVSTFRRDFGGHPTERGDSWSCQPVPYQTLFRIERFILDRKLPLETFIDVGCGVGRPMAFLSRMGFRRLVGIEINPAVAAEAWENLGRIRAEWNPSGVMQILETDVVATDFDFLGAVVFLANPFGERTMRAFLAKLRAQLLAHPDRQIHLFYCLAECQDVVEDTFPKAERWIIPALRDTLVYRLDAAAVGEGVPAMV